MDRRMCRLVRVLAISIGMGMMFGSAKAQEPNSQSGSAQQPAATSRPAAVAPSKEAEIRKLLDATGAKKNAVEFGQQLSQYLRGMMEKSLPPGGPHNQQIEDTLINKLMDHMNSDEFIVRLIPIYDQAFTEDDLKGINRFYETAAGKKLLAQTPAVMEAANDASQEWIQQLIPDIIGQMAEQFPELKDSGSQKPAGKNPERAPEKSNDK